MPLAFLPNIDDGFVLPKLILARLACTLFAILLLARWIRARQVTVRRTPLELPLLAFTASAAFSSLVAVNPNVAIFGTYTRNEGLLTILTYAALFWLAIQLMSSYADASAVIWSFLISGYVVAAIALLQSWFGYLGGGYFHIGSLIRAASTLGNPDFLGVFFAMLLPVAVSKMIGHRPAAMRLLAANVAILLTLGLIATLTRAAWIGAVAGVLAVFIFRHGRFHPAPLVVVASGACLVLLIVLAGLPARFGLVYQGQPVGAALIARTLSIADPSSGTFASRLSVWGDTIPLIASRPILGYGPDTFGLVYPTFQTANRHAILWDKAHEDTLQVGATQGLVGIAAYLWLLVAFIRTFWRGREWHGATGAFAGWVGYEVANQANFSTIPSAMPFWLFAAAAIFVWSPKLLEVRLLSFPRRFIVPSVVLVGAATAFIVVFGVSRPYLANEHYLASLEQGATGQLDSARQAIAVARDYGAEQSVYAVQAGDLALGLDRKGNPSSSPDWPAALEAYQAAARLGSDSPEMFRHLAIVDLHDGDREGAIAAAKRALQLDRYDLASQRLVKSLTQATP